MLRVPLLYLCSLFILGYAFCQSIKEADLAGSWYSDSSEVLSEQIDDYLKRANVAPIKEEVVALVCPHAGIQYSGDTAAHGFLAVSNKEIDTVILIGFSHRMSYDGIAVFNKKGYKTPLGVLYTDEAAAREIVDLNEKIFPDTLPFEQENSVELILPFIQVSFKDAKVLLLAMGKQSFENCEVLGDALYEILKNRRNFLIIASTDMSHHFAYSKAKDIDSSTANLITRMQPKELFSQCYGRNRMCGLGAVTSAMIAAQKLGADEVKLLKKTTSARLGGQDEKVVGYLSAAFIKKEAKNVKESEKMGKLLDDQQKKELLKLSRDTITLYLDTGRVLERETDSSALKKVMGVFVTLHKGHQLRGCIGNIIGTKPLYLGIRDMSIASATQDSRFPPVTRDELDDINIEISVLSPLKRVASPDEIVLGTHGVLVRDRLRSGVYLPQVATETGWSKEQFMDSLCAHKAGINPGAWKKGECQIYVFTAEVFGE